MMSCHISAINNNNNPGKAKVLNLNISTFLMFAGVCKRYSEKQKWELRHREERRGELRKERLVRS